MIGKCLLCEEELKALTREELDDWFTKHNDKRHLKQRRKEIALIMKIKK